MNIEQYYDNMYEKSIQDTYPEDCEKCNGTGKIWISDCCGAVVQNSNCTDCGQLCTEVFEQCETCKGVGEILEEEP